MAGISLVLYTTLYLCVTGVKADYVLSDSIANWKTAKFTCESDGGSLLGENSTLVEHHIQIPVWLDGVATWSPWVINAGCYKYISNAANINELRRLNGGSAISCIQFCQNQFPVGLVENTCYCLKPDFKFEKVSREKCSRECFGNRNNLCGGVDVTFNEYITVYKDSQEIQTLDVPGDGECLTVEIISRKKQYKARSCTSTLHVLCQNESDQVEIEPITDWYGALNVCKTNFELANDQFTDNRVKKNKEYWVGYFRESYSVWEKTGYVKNPIGCYLLENGQQKITNCSQPNNFICVGAKDKFPVSLTTLPSLSLSTRQPNKQKDEDGGPNYPVTIGVSVAVGLVLLIIVIAIIIVCKHRRCCCKRCQSEYHSKNKKSISTTIVIDNSPASGSFNQERVHVYEALRRGENPPEPEPNQSVAQTDSRSYDQVYDYVDQERNCAPCIDQNKQRPAHPLPNDVKTPESYQIHGHAYIEMIAESDEQYDDTVVSSTGPSDNKGNRTYPKQNFGSCIQHDEFTRSSDDQISEKSYQEPVVRSPSDNDEKEKNMANNNKSNEKSNIINDTHVEPTIESSVDRQVVSYADDGYLKPATKNTILCQPCR